MSNVIAGVDISFIIERAKKMITAPRNGWVEVSGDNASIEETYRKWLIPLIGLTSVCSFLGMTLVGIQIPLVGSFRTPLFSTLIWTIVNFAMQLAMIYIAGVVLEFLASKFAGSASRERAIKLIAYAATPGFVAGLFMLIPLLGGLAALFGLYGIYLFWIGVPTMLSVPEDKRLMFVITSAVCFGVVGLVIQGVVGGMFYPELPTPQFNLPSITVSQ